MARSLLLPLPLSQARSQRRPTPRRLRPSVGGSCCAIVPYPRGRFDGRRELGPRFHGAPRGVRGPLAADQRRPAVDVSQLLFVPPDPRSLGVASSMATNL